MARCPRAKEAAQAFVGSDNRNLARITIAAYLGKHLDQVEPREFNISWTKDAVCLDYQAADGQQVREVFTVAKVLELTVRSRLRRAPRR